MRIQLNRRQLLAALCTAGVADLRKYLNGVYIGASATETRTVATNGASLSAQRITAANDVQGVAELIIPRTVVEHIKGAAGPDPWLEKADGGWSLFVDGSQFLFAPIDGKFPDYLRVIPKTISNEPACFSPQLQMQFAKAAKLLGVKDGESVYIRQNGGGSSFIGIAMVPDFIGVIMPKRMWSEEFPDPGMPTWAGVPCGS